jgi:hypothetical protein
MSLEDDLKARALALISQQMANWVVDIQRQIQEHQGNFVRTLDELSESVARYDEKIDEAAIGRAMAEAVAAAPPPPSGPGMGKLKASLAEIEKGTSLSEVLTYLVNEVSRYAERTAMFIVKGPNAIGWYARGVEPADAVKLVNIPLNSDTVFRNVSHSRHAMRGHLSHTPGTAQAMSRLGGNPGGILAVPLLLQRDKLAAVLYCDTQQDEVPAADADLIEILVQFAAKNIDLLSAAPKTAAPAGARTTLSPGSERAPVAAAPAPAARPVAPPPLAPQGDDVGSGTVMFRAAPAAPAARPPAPPAPAAEAESGTIMFKAPPAAPARPAAPPAPPAPPKPAPAAAAIAPEDQKAHEDAKRFARLVVSEIKLYNEAKVAEGRRQKDLYERLKEDIERGRAMYQERVSPKVKDSTNYFVDELVRILAGGDASALGPM